MLTRERKAGRGDANEVEADPEADIDNGRLSDADEIVGDD